MRINKLLPLILVLVVAAGVYGYLNRPAHKLPGQVTVASLSSAAPSRATAELPPSLKGSSVERLTNNLVAFAVIFPQRLSPITDGFIEFRKKVLATKLWKQLDESGMTAALEAQATRAAPGLSSGGEEPKFADFERFLKDEWSEFQEVVVAVQEPSTATSSPALLIQASFYGNKIPARLKAAAQARFPVQFSDEEMNFSITADSPDSTKYKIALEFIKSKMKFDGAIDIQEKAITASVGSAALDTFFTSDSAKGFVSSANWQQAAPAFRDGASMIFWANYPTLMKQYLTAVESLLESAPMQDPTSNATTEAAKIKQQLRDLINTGPYDQFVSSSGSITVGDGLSVSSCALAKPGSTMANAYQKFALTLNDRRSTAQPVFASLVQDRTIVGLKVDLSLAPVAFEVGSNVYSKSVVDEVLKDPKPKAVVETLKKVIGSIDEYKLGEIDVVLNSSPGAMVPELKLLLTHKQGAGQALLRKLKEMLGPSLETLPAEVSSGKGADGKETLTISAGPMFTLVGSELNDSALVFSSAAGMAPDGGSGLPDQLKIAGKSFKDQASASEFAFYFGSKPVIEMVMPYLGMLTAGAGPNGPDQDSINELLGLFEFRWVSVQQTQALANGTICTDAVIGPLK